jgi:chromosome segregation ATPase
VSTANDTSKKQCLSPSSLETEGTPHSSLRHEGLPGHVKQIELVDFMCHDHTTMDFAPHCTFISGKNGSGKSAALQALQCCLGVRATKHGKNASLSKLIRTGHDEALIKVTLWNKPSGDYEAYRHDVYGDSITIERRITQKAHSWAFKCANGTVASRKREELENILRTLNLNASNPVTVMTQNTARGLLGSSSSKGDHEKYDLYMDATQLGTIAENISKTKESLAEMSEHVEKISDAYGELEDSVNDARGRRDKLLQMEDLKEEMGDLEKVFAMEIILEQEVMRDDLKERLRSLDDGDAAATLEEARTGLEALNKRLDEIQERDARHAAEATETAEEVQRVMKELKERKRQLQLNEKKVGRYAGLAEEAMGEKRAAQKALEELVAMENPGYEGVSIEPEKENRASNHLQQLDKAIKSKSEALEVQQKYERMLQNASETLDELQSNVHSLETKRKNSELHQAQLQRQLAHQQSTDRESLNEFGSMASNFVAAIEKAHSEGKFLEKPLGPIGRYLGLRDRTFALAVEVAIGQQLETFLVGSKKDLDTLNQIFKEALRGAGAYASAMPRIGVCDFHKERYTLPPSKVPQCTTVLSLLTCEHPVVVNYLIDMARVEGIALMPSTPNGTQKCKELAQKQFVRSVVDCDGNRGTYRNTSFVFDGFDQRSQQRGPRLGLSKQEKIKELESRLREATSQASSASQELGRLRLDMQKAERAYHEYESKVKDARLEVDHARSTISMLESTRDEPDGNLEAPEDDLRTQIETQSANVMEFQSKVEDAKAQIQSLKKEIAELQERRAGFATQMETRDESLVSIARSRAALKKEIKSTEQFISKMCQRNQMLSEKRSQWEEEVKALQDGIDQAWETTMEIVESREKAAEIKQRLIDKYKKKKGICDHDIEKMFTRRALEKKYEQLTKTIQEAEKLAGGNLADVEAEYERAAKKLKRDGHEMAKNLNLFKGLQDAYKKREAKLYQVDDYVERTVSSKFKHYMKKKGHFGQIRVKRKEKKLEIGVRIGEKNKDTVIKDLKQLSGGERSFATVAFALALGGETEAPFRAMDEFDVFMDSVNRKIAMENLMTFAREHASVQFIFLSPLELSGLVSTRDRLRSKGLDLPDHFLKILELTPPRT